MDEDLIYVTPEIDQEEVAKVMEKYDLVAIPVVDESKVMLGRITIDDVVEVIQEEAEEDLQKMAGLTDDEEFSHSTFRVSRIRLPWLLISLVGELLSAIVLSSYQASIEKVIVASFFIPIVMAMGGSSGQQAAIVMVRSLATKEYWFSEVIKKLFKEFRVALLNGIISAVILLALTSVFFHTELQFSILLSLTLLIIMTNATMVGAMVPLLLKKMGADPVVATGPFVSTSNDIIGLLIYFILLSNFYISLI
jgi:magnesium transporter